MIHNQFKLVAFRKELGALFTLEKRELSGLWIGIFAVVAFLVRLPFAFFPEVIYNDGVEYIRVAKHILAGNWSEGFVPPVYPLLIAGFSFLVKDFELAGILISIIFGAATVLPVYHLTKAVFDGRTAIVALIFSVFQPLIFAYSGSVLTESTYYFIVASTFLLGWLAFERGRVIHVLFFSFFAAMAYLTKPEGICFLFIFLVWVVCISPPWGGKRRFLTRLWLAILCVVCFTAISLPYLVQIRRDLGSWQISKKAAISVGVFQGQEDQGITGISSQHPKRRLDVSAQVKNPLSLLAKVSLGFLESLLKFQQGLTPYLFLFAIVGFLRKKDGHYPWKPNFYSLSHVLLFFGFVLPFFWITKRYTSQMMPVVLPWAAWGFLGVMSWISRSMKNMDVRATKVNAICLGLIVLALFTEGVVSTRRGHRQIQKDVGLWMKTNLPGDVKFMSRLPQESFYSQLRWARIRQTEYNEMLSEARSEGATYLVADDAVLEDVRGFAENIEKGDLLLLKEWRKGNRRILLFRIRDTARG